MYVTTNSAVVWKRMADENQQSAKTMARISAGLLVLTVAVGTYAYSANARNNDLCTSLQRESQEAVTPSAQKLGAEISSAYCA